MSEFVKQFVMEMDIDPATDEDLKFCKVQSECAQEWLEDAYLARAYFWGIASAMENQIEYLGTNYLPNLERKLNVIEGNGYLSENDVSVSWYANEDKPHVNDEIALDDQSHNIKQQIDRIKEKMTKAGILFVTALKNHDEISGILDQLSFYAIKAASKKKVAARQVARA